MENLVQKVIETVNKSDVAFCKFISANEVGKTGSHQAGFYMPKDTVPLMFASPGVRGENKERFIKIRWQSDFETESRFIYYGKGTRNEYRLTRFGRNFPFLTEDNVGDLFVLIHIGDEYYEGYILSTDDEIEDFLTAFNISPTETNKLIDKRQISPEHHLFSCFTDYIETLTVEFPPTIDMAKNARRCHNLAYKISDRDVISIPDKCLTGWVATEYDLFRTIENDRYGDIIKTPFQSVEDLVKIANSILNRRKSRAGKSLEHHLAKIFDTNEFVFDTQAITEGKKKPDFLFPGAESYHDLDFDTDKLILLAAKTTCKDRWRQILNEADRVKTKHLFTLQQGISKNQLTEMYRYGVQLIVPKQYKKMYPEEFRDRILGLEDFIGFIRFKQTE